MSRSLMTDLKTFQSIMVDRNNFHPLLADLKTFHTLMTGPKTFRFLTVDRKTSHPLTADRKTLYTLLVDSKVFRHLLVDSKGPQPLLRDSRVFLDLLINIITLCLLLRNIVSRPLLVVKTTRYLIPDRSFIHDMSNIQAALVILYRLMRLMRPVSRDLDNPEPQKTYNCCKVYGKRATTEAILTT